MAVRILDGSGNSLTSTSGAMDINVKSSSGGIAVTNLPATQPISAVSLPLPTSAAQDGVDGTSITPPTGAAGIRGWLSGIYKVLTGTLAVSGTFWQATQPVSGNVAVSNFPATQPVSLAVAPTTPVTGTFFQTTQPVSVASLPLPTGAATSANQTTPVAKGTQGTTAEPTQDLKDSGRSKVILSSVKVTSVTTEALLTLTQKKGDATVTTGTSYTVTAGKTLRIQSIKMYAELTTAATAAWVSCRLREGAASGGAVSTTSDIVAIIESNTIAVTDIIGMGVPPAIVNFPDGLEIAGGQTLGISELALNVDLAVTVVVIGFEY